LTRAISAWLRARGLGAQFVDDGLRSWRYGGGGEADRHVVEYAGFTGRVDLALRKLWHIDACLDAGAAAHLRQVTRVQKLRDSVQHIEIDDPHQVDTLLPRQPCQPGGRITVGVEGKKGVAVHVGDTTQSSRRRASAKQLHQRRVSRRGIKVVEDVLQLHIRYGLYHDRISLFGWGMTAAIN
jgi:hypothetical protein